MSEVTSRAVIKTALEGVSQAGIVHDYERWSADWTTFLSHFKWRGEIRGWTITCQAVGLEESVLDGATTERFEYAIRGYFGLKDSDITEKTALAKVIEVRDALVAADLIYELPQVSVFEAREFGTVLCHYAEIVFNVVEAV